MSLAIDHYYGCVHKFVLEHDVTWLECAASSVCWSIMLVHYLEDPFGPFMVEKMNSVQGRTEVRGNLFNFILLWQDIERCCAAATATACFWTVRRPIRPISQRFAGSCELFRPAQVFKCSRARARLLGALR